MESNDEDYEDERQSDPDVEYQRQDNGEDGRGYWCEDDENEDDPEEDKEDIDDSIDVRSRSSIHPLSKNQKNSSEIKVKQSSTTYPLIMSMLVNEGIKCSLNASKNYTEVGRTYLQMLSKESQCFANIDKEIDSWIHSLGQSSLSLSSLIIKTCLLKQQILQNDKKIERLSEKFLQKIGKQWQQRRNFLNSQSILQMKQIGDLENQVIDILRSWEFDLIRKQCTKNIPLKVQTPTSSQIILGGTNQCYQKTSAVSNLNDQNRYQEKSTKCESQFSKVFDQTLGGKSVSKISDFSDVGPNYYALQSMMAKGIKPSIGIYDYQDAQLREVLERSRIQEEERQKKIKMQAYNKITQYQEAFQETSFLNQSSFASCILDDLSQLVIQPKKQKSFEVQRRKYVEMQVSQYLKSVNSFTSEINLFAQQMSIPYADFKRQFTNKTYWVTGTLKFTCKYLNNENLQYIGEGMSRNVKQATANAAQEILRMVYVQVPEMWKDFVAKKKKKGIIT